MGRVPLSKENGRLSLPPKVQVWHWQVLSKWAKPKFGMYYGVPAHKCGLPVSTLGITQGGLHSERVHTIYAQEVRDIEGSHCWTTTKTCAWCNKAFSNGELAMNHMLVHYRIALVIPLCGKWGSHSYSPHERPCQEMQGCVSRTPGGQRCRNQSV